MVIVKKLAYSSLIINEHLDTFSHLSEELVGGKETLYSNWFRITINRNKTDMFVRDLDVECTTIS